jgi:hypothetical protein
LAGLLELADAEPRLRSVPEEDAATGGRAARGHWAAAKLRTAGLLACFRTESTRGNIISTLHDGGVNERADDVWAPARWVL